jgi:hypothetical protein
MLVTQSDESRDHNPDAVDLGSVVAALRGEEEGQANEKVAHDASSDVVAPVDIDAAFCLGDGVGALGV